MTEYITLTLPAEMKYLHLVSRFGARVADSITQPAGPNDVHGFSRAFELALSEVFTNAVKHKDGLQDESQVIIEFEAGENKLTVRVKDRNPRFDMESASAPQLSDYPDSGYGIFLLKQVMDTVTYRRKEGWNMITMAKNIVLL